MGSIWLMAKQRGLEMQLAIICMIFIMTISVRAQTTKSTVCEDAIGAEKCAKRQGNCQKENVKLDCQLTCGECTPANITTLPPTNITTVAPTSNTTTPKTVCEDAIGAEKWPKRECQIRLSIDMWGMHTSKYNNIASNKYNNIGSNIKHNNTNKW